MRLLSVEDEPELAELIADALRRAGFAVDSCAAIGEAEEALAVMTYDCILGLSLLRTLRSRGSSVPILILTARDGLDDRVLGLDAGADDYVVKPFHMPELISRIRALLRRPNAALGTRLELGNLALETTQREVTVAGRPVRLSVREAALLEILLRRSDRVVSREAIEHSLYSFEDELGSNAVEVLVHRLRRKLQAHGATAQVHTLRGIGYLIAEEAP